MANRERKRAERQKRKRRSRDPAPAERGESPEATGSDVVQTTASPQAGEPETFKEKMERRYAESERRNEARRSELEPLEGGERPGAVTVGAGISVLLALIFTSSAVVAVFSSQEINGTEPSPLPLAIFAAALWAMAWGMWKSRYWAVLGFQMLLVLFLLSASASLLAAATWIQVAVTLIILAGSALLFYFMIRAMARIQMPQAPGS
jgi:hypothetical protein